MSSTLEDAEKNARQVQAKAVKLSQIPSRPASGLEIRRARPHDFSISAAGSPQATAAPPATSTPMSAMAVSNIPKAPQTPSNAPVPKSLNSKSAAGHRSSLPVPRCGHKMLIPQSPPALERKLSERLANLDKPLPSPPIARFINPNSPAKAQRTLVDAEAGSPSVAAWPVLRPENISISAAKLTTNDTVAQQHQQQHCRSQHDAIFNTSDPEKAANTLVKNRKTFSWTASASRKSPAAPQDEHLVQPVERRSFSSNNPYAKVVDTVSSEADASSRRPKSHKASTPMMPPIPLRRSSKRKSLPLSRHDWAKIPHLSTHTPEDDIESSTAKRHLSAMQPDKSLATDSAVFSLEEPHVTAVTKYSHGDFLKISESEEELSNTPLAEDAARGEMSLTKYEPAHGMIVASPVNQVWVLDPATGWWSKILAWRVSEPDNGPVLRIHQDIEIMLFGDEKNFPEDSNVLDPLARNSLSRTLNSIADRVSWHSSYNATPSIRSPTQSSLPIKTVAKEISPVVISPIRAMRPARQSSAPTSPRGLPSPDQPLPHTREAQDTATVTMVAEANSGTGMVEPSSTEKASSSTGVLPAQLASLNQEDDIAQDVLPEKAKKESGGSQAATPPSAQEDGGPRWMSHTISSLMARKGGRKASQEKTSARTASGASTPVSCPVASTTSTTSRGPSRLKASVTATSAGGTFTVSRSTQTEAVGAAKSLRGEASKSTALLKAKKSLRNLFSRPEVPSKTPAKCISKSFLKAKPEEAKPPSPPPSPSPPESPTQMVFHHLVEIVMSLPSKSVEQMRGLEATEALLHVVTTYKKQRDQARDAELATASSRQTVIHMLKVCGGLFGSEAVEVLGELAEELGLGE